MSQTWLRSLDTVRNTGPLREMVVVVPGESDDIYLRHQQVWAAMAPYASNGQEFIFAQEDDPQVFRIRSSTLPRWAKQTQLPRSGSFEIDMVCSTGEGYRDAVGKDELGPWAERKFARHGLVATSMVCLGTTQRRGTKRVHIIDRIENIAVPVARFTGKFTVENPLLAQEAFRGGLGRGKRFGFGFLRVAA